MTMPRMCFAEGVKFKLHCNDFLKALIYELCNQADLDIFRS